jgi:hypothetical protein
MKKTVYFLLLLLAISIFSCQHEDIYNQNEKLLSIIDYEISEKTPYVSFIYDQDKISKAVFHDQSKFQFEYNDDDQVTIIYGFYGNQSYGHVSMSYIDKKLCKVEYYNNLSQLFQMDTFYRLNGTIYAFKSYLTSTLSKSFDANIKNSNLFKTYLYHLDSKNVQSIIEKSKAGLVLVSYTNVTYTKGNITQLETVYQNGFTTLSTFTYDDEKNPFYGLPFALMDYLNFPSSPLTSYCKNNFKTSTYCEHYGTPGTAAEISYDLVYLKNDYPYQIYINKNLETNLRWQFNYVE